ncbi:MAG TPA: alpha/beta fold hydrolase [Pyrinomonadaceae bacterium]|nr:alpha/beta fold hydrolase [Pyrinomonadaceae bacterium]
MKLMLVAIALLIAFAVPIAAQHAHAGHQPAPAAYLEPGVGEVDHPISTANPEAQDFFNQGLAYLYGFNHDEAVRSFKRASELDPQLAMAYWGMALAQGSNYNLRADQNKLQEAYANLEKAQRLAAKASEHERAYIEALAKRYSKDPQADHTKLALEYRTAMKELTAAYPDDLDAATLYAESMMNLRPWQLWTLDGKPAEGTEEIVAVLEGVLRRNPNHTGANHYYIHAVEASKSPERALASASRLGKLAPKAGHLVHMPSHIYIRTGDYLEAAKANVDAIVADREYIQKSGAQGVYPMMYYNHNIHFLAAANAMKGRYADAIKSARELEANVKPHLKAMPMLEMFMPYTTVTLVRFRKWDEMLQVPKPDGDLKITNAYWHFGRGMAYAGTGDADKADAELKSLRAVFATIPEDAGLGNGTARGVIKVAEQMLAGQIAFARGDKAVAMTLLENAVTAEDQVNYNEPADWDIPARELLGGVLLTLGEHAGAEKVFRAEIAKHQRNGRALFGLVESLKRQGKESSARLVQREFAQAWANADTQLSVEILAGAKARTVASSHHAMPGVRFSGVDLETGVRLNYAEQGDPNGEPLIMLHGYTDSWFSYSRVLPLLRSRYWVYVLDQRGHGDSERPASGYSMRDFARDVLAFMDAKGLKSATIVGHSMGSFVAQHVAATAPDRVNRLVLIGSAASLHNEVVRALQKEVNSLQDPLPERYAREFQESTVARKLPDDFMNGIVKESLKIPARVWQQVVNEFVTAESVAPLEKIRARTLIIWGDKEATFSRTEQDALLAAISGSRLKVYPNTGHSPHWEEPEKFVKDLEGFLQS